jgi:hypothetical protein
LSEKQDSYAKMNKLNPKQEAFVEAYLRLQNGRKAYKEVYDKAGRMSDVVADASASESLRKPWVKAALRARQEQIRALNPVCTVEELAEGWSDDIKLDIAELVDERGNVKNPKDLSPRARRLIQGVKITETITGQQIIEYKLPDRQRARVELGKRIEFYPAEKIEHSGVITTKVDINDADRELLRRGIDASINKLMEGPHGAKSA